MHNNEGELDFYIMSDKLNDSDKLKLHVSLIDFTGKVYSNNQIDVVAKANASEKVYSVSISDFATASQQENSVVHAELKDKSNKTVAESKYYFYWPYKLNLPKTDIKHTIAYKDGKYTITLSSKNLAKNVFVETPIQGAKFSDNFFDLLPGEKRVITISSPELKKSIKSAVSIKHLRETYK